MTVVVGVIHPLKSCEFIGERRGNEMKWEIKREWEKRRVKRGYGERRVNDRGKKRVEEKRENSIEKEKEKSIERRREKIEARGNKRRAVGKGKKKGIMRKERSKKENESCRWK